MRTKHPNTIIKGCGFHHVAIRTSDWDASRKFWQQGLGFVPAAEWGEAPRRACLLDTGEGNYLEIFEREPLPTAEAEAPLLHFCFRTDDCDAATERARQAGAAVTTEPKTLDNFAGLGPVRIAFITGPSGEVCEFFQGEVL